MIRISMGLVIAAMATFASAASINVGDHTLLPNTPGQKVAIYVTGGDFIASADLLVQIGDGGPELVSFEEPAGTDAPGLVNPTSTPDINIQSPTFGADVGIFSTVPNGGQSDALDGSIPQLFGASILVDAGTISANGLLATFLVDTTGFTSGTWDLKLTGTLAGNTVMYDGSAQLVPLNIINGHLSILVLLTGDVNGDQVVNQLDLNVVFGNWLATDSTLAQGDANGDGVVNQLDINTITGNWLATGAANGIAGISVPEPASFGLASFAAIFLMRRRRLRTLSPVR